MEWLYDIIYISSGVLILLMILHYIIFYRYKTRKTSASYVFKDSYGSLFMLATGQQIIDVDRTRRGSIQIHEQGEIHCELTRFLSDNIEEDEEKEVYVTLMIRR